MLGKLFYTNKLDSIIWTKVVKVKTKEASNSGTPQLMTPIAYTQSAILL